MSVIVIEKLHEAEFPDKSVALHVIVVSPRLKDVVPKRGQTTDAIPLLSVAVALFQLTTPVATLFKVDATMLDGHVITGATTSATSTWNEQFALLLEVSVAMQTTVLW